MAEDFNSIATDGYVDRDALLHGRVPFQFVVVGYSDWESVAGDDEEESSNGSEHKSVVLDPEYIGPENIQRHRRSPSVSSDSQRPRSVSNINCDFNVGGGSVGGSGVPGKQASTSSGRTIDALDEVVDFLAGQVREGCAEKEEHLAD